MQLIHQIEVLYGRYRHHRFELILEAYDKLYCDIDKKGITDDAMVVEKYMNTKGKMTLSEYTNIKATTPEDILVTEVFLTSKKML